ncbi:MAG: hypothetical protein QXT68_06535 [Halobacteria archaeon]
MEKLVRRGDPAFLLEWFEKHPWDEEYVAILEQIIADRKDRKIR